MLKLWNAANLSSPFLKPRQPELPAISQHTMPTKILYEREEFMMKFLLIEW